MNETFTAAQHIFREPLGGEELETINTLVNHHKGNAALTQQLALDASKLITTSQERLAKQSDAGFFKRLVNAFSGKTSENQLLNQVDTLQMQKFSWHYLKQLQQQNLINAQSIAVIRNNLGVMNDYTIETRDFLEQAIDKIDHRLRKVENQASFNNWSLNIEANKRRFKSQPSTLLVLHLTYDFMHSHRDVALSLSDINYLVVTLEKLDINCDENIKLLDFIIELIDQIEVIGIDRYRSIIKLGFDEHIIDSYFIQNNISGVAFNALYYLSEHYERIVDLIGDDELCSSDEARKKIISKYFGNEFSGLRTTYERRDLISELISGSLVANDIYKEVNGLTVIPDQPDEDEHLEILSLTSSLPDIHIHTFLDNTDSEEARRNYLRVFALCIDNSTALNKSGLDFLTLLAEKADCSDICDEIIGLADNPYKNHEYLPVIQRLLSDDDKAYTWLLDSLFLLTLCQKEIESPQMLRILGALKPTRFKENLPHLLALINESDETQLLDAAAKLLPQTQGWKNIVRYRELRFEQYYTEAKKQLSSSSFTASSLSLSLELTKISIKASEYSFFMDTSFDDGFLSKVGSAVGSSACEMGRKSCLSSLNGVRNKARKIVSDSLSSLHHANSLITRFNISPVEFEEEIEISDYDLDNSATNDDWHDQFSHYTRQIEDTLIAFENACTDANEQLSYFIEGEFDQSVINIKAQKHAERLLQQQQEKLAKQSVTINKDGSEYLFAIEWQQVENTPCDPEKIRHIKTNGKVWLVVDSDGGFYRSEDRVHWQTVQPSESEGSLYIRKLDIVNNTWILIAGYNEGFYYSNDAITWQQCHFPKLPSPYDFSETEDIISFNGQWLWRFTERQKYNYTEKGFIFDSTKTSNYDKTIIYYTNHLDAQWQRWEETPRLPEGVEVECIRSIPGMTSLLAFCKYNWLYKSNKKKNNTSSFVMYHIPGKGWRDCTWNSDNDSYRDVIVTQMHNRLMCFYSGSHLTSDKGYEWNQHNKKLYIDDFFHLDGLSLFSSRCNGQTIYLSQNAENFNEIILEDGAWSYFSANKQGALSVYSPNSHETFLKSGTFIFQPGA